MYKKERILSWRRKLSTIDINMDRQDINNKYKEGIKEEERLLIRDTNSNSNRGWHIYNIYYRVRSKKDSKVISKISRGYSLKEKPSDSRL